jgi:hypothetical protein
MKGPWVIRLLQLQIPGHYSGAATSLSRARFGPTRMNRQSCKQQVRVGITSIVPDDLFGFDEYLNVFAQTKGKQARTTVRGGRDCRGR